MVSCQWVCALSMQALEESRPGGGLGSGTCLLTFPPLSTNNYYYISPITKDVLCIRQLSAYIFSMNLHSTIMSQVILSSLFYRLGN